MFRHAQENSRLSGHSLRVYRRRNHVTESIFCISGPSAGILEYSVDGAPFKELDTFTEWSHNLYIPWVYMLETELKDTDHKLVLRISKKKNPASQGTECQIRNFVVNGR